LSKEMPLIIASKPAHLHKIGGANEGLVRTCCPTDRPMIRFNPPIGASEELGLTMSSLVAPLLSPKVASSDYGKSKPPKSSSKSKSARRVKSGVAPASGKDVTHVIRVTVLGLAGITVDRSKCRYSSKDEELPASPSKMRAVVAFSRNSMIRGTTTLSKPLTRSPNDDVVVTTIETAEEDTSVAKSGEVLPAVVTTENEEEVAVEKSTEGEEAEVVVVVGAGGGGDDEATHETKSTKGSVLPPPKRHLAVWTSEDGFLGSTVTFETNLHRSDRGGKKSNVASSAFVPKSFDLTIGLTEGNNSDQTAVALPLGVATLAISGDESMKGESGVTVDLPVWTLSQARPLDTSDGTGGYPLITLAPASETSMEGIPLKKKRTGLQRLFSKKDKNGNIAFPSSAERDAFSSAYSMDSAGDAILRVSLEVYEKGSAGETSKDTPIQTVHDQNSRNVSNRPASPVARKSQGTDSYDDETYDSDEETEYTDETDFTDEATDFTGSLITTEDETITLDDSIVTNEDNRMVFFSWINHPGRPRDDDMRERGKRADRRHSRDSSPGESKGHVSVNVLGRHVRLPACERSNSSDSREDMTHVTADFFGDSYQIPLCRGIAKREDDDDSTTAFTEHDSASGSRIMDIMTGALCQNDTRDEEDDIKIVSTFSTLSENPTSTQDSSSSSKKVIVTNTGKRESDGLSSDKAKVRLAPDEPSEEDDIMRLVRSKQPNPSPKALAVRKNKAENISVEDKKNSVTDESPKGVEELAHMEADETTNPKSRILQTIAEVLQCYPGHNGSRYEPFEPQIPPVIIQSEADAVSVGELTATTHERNIEGASDARLLERARHMLNESRTPKPKETESHKFIPITVPSCGGGGLCSPMKRRDTTSSPIRLGKEETVSIVDGKERQHAPDSPVVEPSADNDDCTTFSPIEVVKVSSEEKETSFSRVRIPSANKRERKEVLQSLYSESLPVYDSMKGDESESVIGAFVESKGERELFNPITGQEVEQAFI